MCLRLAILGVIYLMLFFHKMQMISFLHLNHNVNFFCNNKKHLYFKYLQLCNGFIIYLEKPLFLYFVCVYSLRKKYENFQYISFARVNVT